MSDLSERSDNNDGDDDGTGAEYNKCYGASNGDGRGDMNTGAGGRSAEWLVFLIPSALTEAFGALGNSNASSARKL